MPYRLAIALVTLVCTIRFGTADAADQLAAMIGRSSRRWMRMSGSSRARHAHVLRQPLGFEEIPYAFDLVDRAELRTDQDFVKAHLLDALDAPACLL